MNYRDRIYGQTEIKEPVILDLINSPVLQRLKEIDQAGYFEPYHPGSKHSRFEHSVGVYLLLRKFGASLKEQIAGLIHDVSHSAFSHAIDYALSEGSEKEQSHQDNYFEEYVLNSTIPRILEKYEINVDHILDKNNFPLLETQLPDLCADRIDYSLRGLLVYGIVQEDKIKDILSNLIIENKAWVFRDLDSAYEYAKLFKDLNEDYYSGLETAVMFRRVGDYLKYALGKNYACREDLYTTDKEVIDKINQNLESDGKLKNLWDRMNNSRGYENNTDDYDAKVYCKSRVIDPFCRHKGEIKRVSAVKLNWKGIVEKESRPKVYFLKFNDVK
jgi:HD superfamily phosphohydrolase